MIDIAEAEKKLKIKCPVCCGNFSIWERHRFFYAVHTCDFVEIVSVKLKTLDQLVETMNHKQ
jgi:hypothetical protein